MIKIRIQLLLSLALLMTTCLSLRAKDGEPKKVKTFYGELVNNSGSVRVKRLGSLNWFDAGEKERVNIGDLLYVGNGSKSTLRIPMTMKQLSIPANTILRFSKNLPKASNVERKFSPKNKGDKMKKVEKDPKQKAKYTKPKMEPVTYTEKQEQSSGSKKKKDKKKKKKPEYNKGQVAINVLGPKDKFTFYNEQISSKPEEVSFSWKLSDEALERFFGGKDVEADYRLQIWATGQEGSFCCGEMISDNGYGEAYYVVKIDAAGKYYFQVSTVLPGGASMISKPQMFEIKEEEANLENVDLNKMDGSSIIIQ